MPWFNGTPSTQCVIMCNDVPIATCEIAHEQEIGSLIYDLKNADRDRHGRSTREWRDYDQIFHWRAIRVPHYKQRR